MTMKHTLLGIALLSIAVVAGGCKPASEEPPGAASDRVDPAKVKADAKETMQDMKDYTFAEKDVFLAKMRAQLADINRELDQLSERIGKASDAAKAEAKPRLQSLRDQAGKLNVQLEAAKETTESTWSEVKAGFKEGYAELKEGFQQARQWVSDKIAP